MSRYFRPPIGTDPFWDSFWSNERNFFDSHFGSTLTEEDLFPSNYFIRRRSYGPRGPLMGPPSPLMSSEINPLTSQLARTTLNSSSTSANTSNQASTTTTLGTVNPNASGGLLVTPASDKYQIMVDVSHFTPEEISVKMVDNTIVVIGKHEDKADNYGYVSRQFSRKYLLPADVEPETVNSTLSADGILTIQAHRKLLQIKDTEGRSVPIAVSNQCISPVANLAAPHFPVTPQIPPQPQQTQQQLQQPSTMQTLQTTFQPSSDQSFDKQIVMEKTITTTTTSTASSGQIDPEMGQNESHSPLSPAPPPPPPPPQ